MDKLFGQSCLEKRKTVFKPIPKALAIPSGSLPRLIETSYFLRVVLLGLITRYVLIELINPYIYYNQTL